MLLRTDPKHHKLFYLSIPRDLRVPDIPGHGPDKINAAFQIGGARLAARTVHAYTGLPINHVVVVNFHSFSKLIDKIGGIDVNVPEPILSNSFDCPFKTQARCAGFKGWRFEKGVQHMNGYRALIYSRVRENKLNPRDSDISRGSRQQDVMQALTSKLASSSTFLKLPFIGGDLLAPIATDLTPTEFMQLGWLKFRAGPTIHCRLGGTWTGSYIEPSEDNRQVILMVTGKSAIQPPPPNGDTYPPGCFVGRAPLNR
jgi:LCP family protein required for cell wall assembly